MARTLRQRVMQYLGLDGSATMYRWPWWVPAVLALLLWTGAARSLVDGRSIWGGFQLVAALLVSILALQTAQARGRSTTTPSAELEGSPDRDRTERDGGRDAPPDGA